MRRRAKTHEGEQVYCTSHDEGREWFSEYDELPAPVRLRLRESAFNLCPTCVAIDAERNQRRPTVATYVAVIEAIEHRLRE